MRAAGSPHKDRRDGAGYAYLHTALDDHSGTAWAYSKNTWRDTCRADNTVRR